VKKLILYLVFAISLSTVFAVKAEVFFLPPGAANSGVVTQQKADQVALNISLLYYNDVFQKTGLPLLLQERWEDPYFGASATKSEIPHVVSVYVRGGLVRVPEMTENILALVLCHELGHVLGGAPYQDIPGSEWTSIEGQADFFASSQCLPKYLQKISDDKLSSIELKKKVLETSLAATLFFQKYSPSEKEPVALEKTASEIATTLNRISYPSLQCRLDTFKAGASCVTGPTTCKAPACWLPR
jgi:hypothetical protein